jgi:hypothetical protein
LSRCRWQTPDESHSGRDAVPGTGVACMSEQVWRAVAERVKSYHRRLPRSLHALPCDVMPTQTIQVAHAAFPKGHPSMRRRDARGPIDTTPIVAARFSHTGRSAEAPAPRPHPGHCASVRAPMTPPSRPRGHGHRRLPSRRGMPVALASQARVPKAHVGVICGAHGPSDW